jgi:hypothetical protein
MKARKLNLRITSEFNYVYLPKTLIWKINSKRSKLYKSGNWEDGWTLHDGFFGHKHMLALGWKNITINEAKKLYPLLTFV